MTCRILRLAGDDEQRHRTSTGSSVPAPSGSQPWPGRAGDWLADEIGNWDRHGGELVVSLLEPGSGRSAVAGLCGARGIEFVSLPIADRGTPEDLRPVMTLAREITGSRRAVAIHCRAGIGRASLVAAAALCGSGMTPDAALSAIGRAHGLPVPDTDSPRDWVERFHEALEPIRPGVAPKVRVRRRGKTRSSAALISRRDSSLSDCARRCEPSRSEPAPELGGGDRLQHGVAHAGRAPEVPPVEPGDPAIAVPILQE